MKTTQAEIDKWKLQASQGLAELESLALKEDVRALEVLANLLCHYSQILTGELLKNVEYARKLTRRCPIWPGVITVDKDIQKWQAAVAKRLELGQAATTNYNGRQWSRRTPEIRAALKLKECVVNRGHKLPPFNRATAGLWWKAARPYLEKVYGDEFENHSLFKHYLEDYKRIHRRFDLNPDYDPPSSIFSLKMTTWARSQITTKLAQAFKSIAPK